MPDNTDALAAFDSGVTGRVGDGSGDTVEALHTALRRRAVCKKGGRFARLLRAERLLRPAGQARFHAPPEAALKRTGLSRYVVVTTGDAMPRNPASRLLQSLRRRPVRSR